MARTTRKAGVYASDQDHRAKKEERHARWQKEGPGEFEPVEFPIVRRFRGGNMLMMPSVCGKWDDERSQTGPERDKERRTVKRSERHKALREAEREMMDEFDANMIEMEEGVR